MHSMNIKNNLFIYNIIEIEQYPFKPHRKKGLKSECCTPKERARLRTLKP